MPEDLDQTYETHDIYLAAYFAIAGCTYLRKRKAGSRVHFVFTNVGGTMQQMREAFYSGQAKVVANQYAQQIQHFKQLCFE
jgi:NADH:ubiquinone oxidoreductase subunit D